MQQKVQEIKELREILQMENQEKGQLRREIEQVTRERDEYFRMVQVQNERKLALEKEVADLKVSIEDLTKHLASNADHIESLEKDKRNLEKKCKELIMSSSHKPLNCEFSFEELKKATENFSPSLKIGNGAFGPVYKGYLRKIPVAIKMLHTESVQGIAQFQQEVNLMYRHRN